jgi:hypothetical protein
MITLSNNGVRMRAVLLTLLLMLALPAAAQTWVKYGEDGDREFFYDSQTIRGNGQFRRVWQLNNSRPLGFNSKDPEVRALGARVAPRGLPSTLYLIEFDCHQERYRHLSFVLAHEGMGKGQSETLAHSDHWRFTLPSGPERTLFKLVCAARK